MTNGSFGSLTFDTPKPHTLIERIIKMISDPDAIILDSFAGSGTTAHAVLNMNKADGGNRKFILVEMMDYADSITAERVKRVIRGYGQGKNAVEGTGGDFSFYDLGEPLLIGENLNGAVGAEKIREYVWFMETKSPYAPAEGDNPYFLGRHNDTSYYFYYEPERITVLDYAFLSGIRSKSGGTVIYADRCALGEDKLAQMGIACNSVRPIFDALPVTKTKAVVWLVPSDAILTQTVKALKDVRHPYRQKIDVDFSGRVEVYTKEELLNGQNFNPTAVTEQLSIMVLSYDSFRGRGKEGLKAYQENSNLANFAKVLGKPENPIEKADESALFQIINQLSPLVIVDESHHARSELSIEMLANLTGSHTGPTCWI